MARKANIAREEIIVACWSLLEQNYFPNIPRLADYFLKQDGRKCSNTTFLKAITEWEELYKERQDASFNDLSDVFMPSFKKFERDVSRNLQALLEEKLYHEENTQVLKQDATKGQYLSLSTLVEQQAEEIESQAILIHDLTKNKNLNEEKNTYLEKRYQETLSTLKAHQVTTDNDNNEIRELNLNLAQKGIDLAKLELKLTLIDEERVRLLTQNEVQLKQIQALNEHVNNIGDVKGLTEQVEKLVRLQKLDTLSHHD